MEHDFTHDPLSRSLSLHVCLTGFLTRLTLCSRESSHFLLQVLESVTEADLEAVLERILGAVEKQPRGVFIEPCAS